MLAMLPEEALHEVEFIQCLLSKRCMNVFKKGHIVALSQRVLHVLVRFKFLQRLLGKRCIKLMVVKNLMATTTFCQI